MRWYRFAILFLLAGYNSHAQISYYNFTVNDGLPSNETYCVLQDRQGYIWIGTDHGVARYDGHEFKTFTTENGLTDNTVFLLKEDKQGKIWCLTFSGGVCYYDGRNFKPHPDNDTIKAICKREIPTSWAITGNGDLWLGFHRTGICKFSGHQTRIFEFGAKPILADSSEFVILNLKDNELVYTSVPVGSNLNATDSDIKSVVHFSLPQKLIGGLTKNFALIRLNNGAFAVSQWKEFVYVENGKATASLKFPSKTEITTSQSLDGKSIWILVQNGASYCIRPQNGSMQIIDSLILTNAATGIITDNQGNNWVSTLNAGLLMIQNPGIKLFDFRRQGIDNRAYSFKQFGNYLYVGLSQNCYFKIDTLFKGEFKQGKRFPSAVLDFAPDKRNDVITDVDLSVKLNDLLIFRCMLPMDSGYLLGAGAGGIVILNREFQPLFNSQHVGFKNRVNRLAKIAPSRYAIGTNVGLYYFDTRAGFEITEEKFFKNTRITSCKALNDSVYAVATRGKGVFFIIKNKIYTINTNKGLKTNLNEDVYFENDSVLWIASYKGIAKVYFSLRDSLNTRIKCYTREDGLCSDQVNAIIGFNGHIWLATNEGICYFKPESLRETECEIPVYFGNVFINGVKRNPDSLDLKFNQNNLLIQFHGLYYKATSGVRYKVRLKGREPWKYTNQGFVQYFNLPAGEYEFEVAAEDEAGKYASPLIKLRFVIRARFIDTVWFKGLLIFCALAIVFYIAYLLLRYQRLKAQNFIHLHKAEFKALNYQINPHFIFNVLNSIQYYILRKDSDKAVHFLNSFSILIRRIVTNSRQQYISIIEEIECLKEYMDLEKLRLDNKFDYEINIDSSINIEAKILLPMIIQPVIENAIWHGIVPSGTRGRVKVDFAYDNKNIVVTVEDNGVGLNPDWENDTKSPQHLSMAMTNVKERLKIIGDLNDDDTWYIRMLDKRAKGGNESGTLVFIRFPEIKRDLL